MALLRLTLECRQGDVEALSVLLEQFAAIAISSEALSDEELYAGVSEQPRYWERTALAALLDDSIDMDILLACARNRVGANALLDSRIEAVRDENWLQASQVEGGEMVFADSLCIRPGWVESDHEWPAVLTLDPGLAFGSGRHETTTLCLEWLARNPPEGLSVIDYGCGSGILGLAACRLGADKVQLFDIDPQALLASRQNAEKNALAEKLTIHEEQQTLVPGDLLLANILLNPLKELAQRFHELLRPRARIVLSGILANQVDECLAAYSPWFTMTEPVFREEWAMLGGTHHDASHREPD